MASHAQIKANRYGPGRPTGRPNKSTGQAKENIGEVFEKLGGIEAMARWASKHPTAFYRMYIKLIGVNIQPKADEALKQDDNKALERIFLGIIAARKDGKHPLVTDRDPSVDGAPELIVGPTNGSAMVDKRSG